MKDCPRQGDKCFHYCIACRTCGCQCKHYYHNDDGLVFSELYEKKSLAPGLKVKSFNELEHPNATALADYIVKRLVKRLNK